MKPLLPWVLIAFGALAQLSCLPGTYMGSEHDDAHYALAAKALLRGEYRLGVLVGDPPLTIITPGYPALLTPAALLSFGKDVVFHLWAWCWLVLCDVLVWLWFSRRASRSWAMAATAAFMFNPLVLSRAGAVMTEIPALALTLLLFMGVERGASPWSSGALGAFLWLVRQPSIALLPGLLAPAILARSWKKAFVILAPWIGVVSLWMIWLSRAHSRLTEVDELRVAAQAGLSSVLSGLGGNIHYYAGLWGGFWLPAAWAQTAGPGLGIFLFGLSFAGAWRILRRTPGENAVLWLFFGALMHGLYPWRYERYLLPFIPMLLWTAGEALARFKPGSWRLPVFCAMLSGQFAFQGLPVIASIQDRGVLELAETYAWMRENIKPESAVASLYYSRDAWHVRRPWAPLPGGEDEKQFVQALRSRRIRYVLDSPEGDVGSSLGRDFPAVRELLLIRAHLHGPGFRLVYENAGEGSRVFELR